MTEMIDKEWRSFLNGDSVNLLRGIIQDSFDSFFSFAMREGLTSEDPKNVQAFITAQETRDLQRISGIYMHDFQFNYKGERFSSRLQSFSQSLRRVMGHKDYNQRMDVGERIVTMSETYTNFFSAARQLGFYRNDDAHKKYAINDSGFALGVASTALKIVELSPNEIRNQESLSYLKNNLSSLLKSILEKENPNISLFEDDDEESSQDDENPSSDSIDNSEIIAKIVGLHEGIGTLKDSMIEIKSAVEKISHLEGRIAELQDSQNYQTVGLGESMPVMPEGEELLGYEVPFDEPIIRDMDGDDGEGLLVEEVPAYTDTSVTEDTINSYTPQQALNEMLLLQKLIKRKFRCKNWENIAQGPFREMVIKNKIKTKEAFLENQFIQNRYYEHKYVMDEIFDSSLGQAFFEVLSKVTYAEED